MTERDEAIARLRDVLVDQFYRGEFQRFAEAAAEASSVMRAMSSRLAAFKDGGMIRFESNPGRVEPWLFMRGGFPEYVAKTDYSKVEARIMSHYFNTGETPRKEWPMPQSEYEEKTYYAPKGRVSFDSIFPGPDPRFAEERVAAQVAANVAEDIERARAAKGPRKITSNVGR